MNKTADFTLHTWDGSQAVITQFAALLSDVYQRSISAEHMMWKHLHNPVGPSLITYAQDEQGNMGAARAFWPMYSEKGPLYQPCDTVTHPNFQRRGLFSTLTKMCLDKVENHAAIVNFPNHNSYPAYLKLGWQLYAENKKTIGLSVFKSAKPISDLRSYLTGRMPINRIDYLCWRFSTTSGKHYRFFEHAHGVLVDNDETQGLIAIGPMKTPYGMSSGIHKGYVLPDRFSTATNALTGKFALPCHSRTAFYLPGNAVNNGAKDSLEHAFSLAQVNTLMDTF